MLITPIPHHHHHPPNSTLHAAPFVKFMMKNLERVGCKIDIEKHIKCEPCPMAGAFDAVRNEVR